MELHLFRRIGALTTLNRLWLCLTVLVGIHCGNAFAGEPASTNLAPVEPALATNLDSEIWRDVRCNCTEQPSCRRFYLSAMIGPSFASLNDTANSALSTDGSVFAAGGALGVALERGNGRLRLEIEGAGRSTYISPIESLPGFSQFTTNNWSVLGNAWRDLMITERAGIYGGGGIGAGGYILGQKNPPPFEPVEYVPAKAAFAWQAGGGLIYELTDNITFDVGYRFFQIGVMQQTALTAPNQFQSSEVMFTARVFEPFSRWRR